MHNLVCEWHPLVIIPEIWYAHYAPSGNVYYFLPHLFVCQQQCIESYQRYFTRLKKGRISIRNSSLRVR